MSSNIGEIMGEMLSRMSAKYCRNVSINNMISIMNVDDIWVKFSNSYIDDRTINRR